MILLCYDGSADAKAAIQRAAALFPRAPATVLAVWQPYVDMITQDGFGLAYASRLTDVEEVDAAIERQALDTAREGTDQATSAGMAAESRIEPQRASVAAAILAVAGEIGADAIVVGTRGRGAVKSLLLGSVSHAVVHHADRPVVIVPSDTGAREVGVTAR